MTHAYGSVPSPRRLSPRERDPVTGRRTRGRDEKDRSSDRPRARARPRWLVGAAVLAVVVAAAAAVVVSSSGDEPEDAAARRAAEERALALVPGPTVAVPDLDDPTARAITLTYRGGRFSERECTNLLGGGCAGVEFSYYDTLTLRCTPDGCALQDTALGEVPLAGGTGALSGQIPHGDPACGTQDLSISVRAVGTATTHGIDHPARLVGQATNEAPASLPGNVNCLGRSEVYEFDATPG